MAQITYPTKSTGSQFFATEANEIKTVVNTNQIVVNYENPNPSVSCVDDLQFVINNNIGSTIVIGRKLTDIFLIDKPLLIPSNSILEINGEIKIMDGYTIALTADLNTGDNTIQVANANTYFRAGQQIIVSCDDVPYYGGGAWKVRRGGTVNEVLSVTSTTITCKYTFTTLYGNNSAPLTSYTVAANAKVGQYNTCLDVFQKSNVVIRGNGLLNGNFANQYGAQVVGVTYQPMFSEALQHGCGISMAGNTNVKISGLKITDFVMSGIAHTFYDSSKCEFENLEVTFCGEKNIVMLFMLKSVFNNIIVSDGRDEGEFTFYNGNYDITVSNVIARNNKRNGFAIIGAQNARFNITNVWADNCLGSNINLNGENINATNLLSTAGAIVVTSLKNSSINGIKVSNTPGGGNISLINTSRVNITGLSINNSFGGNNTGQLAFQDCTDTHVNGFSISDVHSALFEIGSNVRCILSNGNIRDYTSLYRAYVGNLIFRNVYDQDSLAFIGQDEFQDEEFAALKGSILIDRTTATKYRLKVDSGVLGVEMV